MTRPRLILAAALTVLAGCHDDSHTPAAESAEKAVGVEPGSKTTRTIETKRDVIVQEEKKVVDAKTGEVLKDEKTSTPVTITEEKSTKTDVKVNVGNTNAPK